MLINREAAVPANFFSRDWDRIITLWTVSNFSLLGLIRSKHHEISATFVNLTLMLLQPPYGTAIQGKDVVICKFPSDPTIVMGSLSIVALAFATIVGHFAVFHSYSGKSVPRRALFQSTSLSVFFVVAE
jgi:hypothetical protein